jgi:hypothetical protein
MRYSGSCHCGAVQFEVDAPEHIAASECNCSMCSRAGYLHLIVAKSKFRLLRGAESITTYTFNTGIAKHTFCKICGVKSFYVPRSNPDGYSVNVRCLTPPPATLSITAFDGRNWEQHAEDLAHLSRET